MTEELPKDLAKGLLAKIHIAKKDLGLSDDEYRSLLEGCTGKRSCKGMSAPELNKVLARFRELGWVPKGQKGTGNRGQGTGKKRRKLKTDVSNLDEQGRKIVALWITLAQQKVIQDRSDTAMRAWLFRQFKVKRLEWLSVMQKRQAIEQLKAMLERGETDD
ncbi:MAG: regulatory protein GemA [Cyanobacteria bacterium P01_F01_bin.56]